MSDNKEFSSIIFDPKDISALHFDEKGLIPAIVQEQESKEVLMMAWMDKTALLRTLETGRSWFYSRSRQQYWCKGETSGNRQWVRQVSYDCDGDVLLLSVIQEGAGACHTGEKSCFYRFFQFVPND